LEPGADDYAEFGVGLIDVCQETAKALVRDGEGATKFVEIVVSGTATDAEAGTIARAIATSQLCKTAFFGEDPNWGRFACAAGYAGVPFDPKRFSLWIDDVQVMSAGMPAAYAERDAAACMQKPQFCIRVEVGEGPGAAVFWTSDLSHGYVEINADYRT
jgi:glutamate N-acetyltransferase/amino-acid N-acetyltransferase